MKKNVWKLVLVPALLSGLVACGNTDDTKEKEVTHPPKQEKPVEVKGENSKTETNQKVTDKEVQPVDKVTEEKTTEEPTVEPTKEPTTTIEKPATEPTEKPTAQKPTEPTKQPSTTESGVVTEKGTFVGLIDGSSFEVTVNGQSRTLRFDSALLSTVNNLKDDQSVEIQYTKNSYGQLLLKSIK